MEKEIFKDIAGYEGIYQITSHGRVLHIGKGFFMKLIPNKDGRLRVGLSKNNKQTQFSVSRLVATHFIPNPNNLPEVDHMKSKVDNQVWNLQWVTSSENVRLYFKRRKTRVNIKTVYVYHLDGSFYKTFPAIGDAAKELGITRGNIGDCLSGQAKQMKGYRFFLKPKKSLPPLNKRIIAGTKPVKAIYPDGSTKIFEGLIFAAEANNVSSSRILKACKGLVKTVCGVRYSFDISL